MNYDLVSDYAPTGDQPHAIEQLTEGIDRGDKAQVLLGVTGSGKTFTIANVIKNVNKPTLILSHNKTLAAQLYQEMKGFFPHNAVEYYVSYYDYYQPEAYLPSTDTYIEKDLAINENIDKQEETQEELQEIIQEEEEKKEEGKEEVHDITPQESSNNDDVVRNQTTISPTKELAETSTKETAEETSEKQIEELAEKPIEETAEKLIEEPAEEQIEDFDKEENSHNFTTILLSIASCLLLMAASAYIGYLYGIEEGRHQEKTSQISKYSTYLDKQNEELRTKRLAEEAKATKEAEKTKNDTTKQTAKDNKTDTTTNNQPKENNKTKEDNNDDNFSKYDTMDARVRTGAYVIVGIDKYIIVREGQTVGKIAKALLGPGMSCYIEVLNGVTENEPLKEGTKIKIPKLRHKKATKKK